MKKQAKNKTLRGIQFLFISCTIAHVNLQATIPFSNAQRQARNNQARNIRTATTNAQAQNALVTQNTNNDLTLYPTHYASYAKGLLHNNDGSVNAAAFDTLIAAITSGNPTDFNNIIMGGARKFTDPQAAYAFVMEGADCCAHTIRAVPAFASAEAAGEMVEVYWSALLRDIPFNAYSTNSLAKQAVNDLNNLSDFRGPKVNGNVTRGTLFRGPTPGDLVGPYISQFLYQPIPSFEGTRTQSKKFPKSDTHNDFLTSFDDWFTIQNGGATGKVIRFESDARFIKNGRDLGDLVHLDYPGELSLNAGLILLGYGPAALDDNNPYKTNTTQAGFVTYAITDLFHLIATASYEALQAAWYQKWLVHLRLRPEEFAFLAHKQKNNPNINFAIHNDLMNSSALVKISQAFGSYLLPQQYPEGSPTHPAYPSGHATIAGACATILKAFFKEDFVIPNPIQPNTQNNQLTASPATLLVGNELNKLASNIAIGRDFAGVHYRSDAIQGMLLGEQVAIAILNDEGFTKNNNFNGYTLTKFDGTVVTVGARRTV